MKTTIPNASPRFLQHHFSAPEMPTKLREGGPLPMPAMVRKAAKQASKTKQNKAKHEEMLAPPLHHPSSVMILIDEGCWEIHSWWPECSQSPILIRDMKNLYKPEHLHLAASKMLIPSDLSSNNEVNINATGA